MINGQGAPSQNVRGPHPRYSIKRP